MDNMFENKPDNTVINGIKDLIHLKATIKELEKRVKKLKEDYAGDEERVYNLLENQDIQSVGVNGHNAHRRVDIYAGIADKESVFTWLKQNGYEDMIQPGINTRTLTGVVRELIDQNNGNMGAVPECINVNVVRRVGIRKN